MTHIEIPIEFRTSFGLDNFDAEHTRLMAISNHFKNKRKINKLSEENKRLKAEIEELKAKKQKISESDEETETSTSDDNFEMSDHEETSESDEEANTIRPKRERKTTKYSDDGEKKEKKIQSYPKASLGPTGYMNRATANSSILLDFTEPIHIGYYRGHQIRFFGEFEHPYCLLKDLCKIVDVPYRNRTRLVHNFSSPEEKAKIMYADPKKDEFLVVSEKGVDELFEKRQFRDEEELQECYRDNVKKIKANIND